MFLFPVKMFSGQLKPAQAFMSGKLKISGNMGQVILFLFFYIRSRRHMKEGAKRMFYI